MIHAAVMEPVLIGGPMSRFVAWGRGHRTWKRVELGTAGAGQFGHDEEVSTERLRPAEHMEVSMPHVVDRTDNVGEVAKYIGAGEPIVQTVAVRSSGGETTDGRSVGLKVSEEHTPEAKVAGSNMDAQAATQSTEAQLIAERHSAEGYGEPGYIETPEVHASIQQPGVEAEHVYEAFLGRPRPVLQL